MFIGLGLSQATIEQIQLDNPLNTPIQIFKALLRWREENTDVPEDVLHGNLRAALIDVDKKEVADTLTDKENSGHGEVPIAYCKPSFLHKHFIFTIFAKMIILRIYITRCDQVCKFYVQPC